MTARITATLDKYKRISRLKEPWRGTKFEWVTELSGTEVSSVGEQLATEIVGGQLLSRSEQKLLGYAVRTHDGKLIEVKTCRKSFSDSNVWSWKQIRLQDDFTHLCLIAIEPSEVRMFLIARGDLSERFLSNQHLSGGDKALAQIAVNNEVLPKWITDFEVK